MVKHNNLNQPSSDGGKNLSSVSYEGVLYKAFDKLTSEVFIFLLTYVILLTGLAWFDSHIVTEIRYLLYIIPILGVVTFIGLRKRTLRKEAHTQRVEVKSRVARDDAYVGGIRGPIQTLPGNIKVASGIASGQAQVIGMDIDNTNTTSAETSQASDAQYMMSLFEHLSQENRRNLISSAQDILNKQEQQNA